MVRIYIKWENNTITINSPSLSTPKDVSIWPEDRVMTKLNTILYNACCKGKKNLPLDLSRVSMLFSGPTGVDVGQPLNGAHKIVFSTGTLSKRLVRSLMSTKYVIPDQYCDV